MQSPKLDRKITLQRATFTQNDFGEQIATGWADLATVWGSKKDVSDGERLQAGELTADRVTRFQIRYDSAWSDLSPVDRLSFESRTYEIQAVKEIGRREGIEITAAARAE